MSQLAAFLTLSLTAMYLEPISSRSALVAASRSSKRLTSDCSIRDSSPKPGDAILESIGEMDFVTMSRIFVGTVGLLAPGSPFKCWSSNLCGKKARVIRNSGQNHNVVITANQFELGSRAGSNDRMFEYKSYSNRKPRYIFNLP